MKRIYPNKSGVSFARIRAASEQFPQDRTAGMSVAAIAEKHRVSLPTVRKYINVANEPRAGSAAKPKQ